MLNNPNNNKKYKLTKKIILVGLVLLLVFSSVGVPKPAKAFDFNQSIWNAIMIPFNFLGKAYQYAEKAYDKLGALGFKQALKKIVGNIAVDTATYIATGDKGQAPMFQTNFGKYIKDEADAFIADELNNRLKTRWGVDLCEPLDPLFKVRLEIGAKEYFRTPRPQCTFTKMWGNIKDARRLKLVDLPKYADMFNPSSNELGVFLQVTTQIQEGQKEKIELTKLELKIEEGWKSVRSKITGKIKTPAYVQKFLTEQASYFSKAVNFEFTGELAADFIGPFVSTLASKLMKKFKEGLVGDDDSKGGSSSAGLGGAYGPMFGGASPIQAAKQRFADLGQPNYTFGGPFDLLNNLGCDNEESQYFCTIDNQFRAALLEQPRLTVREARDRGLLHGEWPVGYRVDRSGGMDSAERGIYSYRSLVILRKYRIIPVGWELAAEYYQKYDRSGEPLTLNKLLTDYFDRSSPYYMLVDPDWVLKAPETICTKEGSGELLADETIIIPMDKNNDGKIDNDEKMEMVIRKPYCADERSVIKDDVGGKYYGYCTKEKPVWDIHSTNGECSAVYNSCRVYTTRDNQKIGYLYNTLHGKDICDAGNVGCREYCVEWDEENYGWACEADGSGERMYLNRYASDNECDGSQAGCSEFIRVSTAILVDDEMTSEEAVEELSSLAGEEFDTVVDYDFSSKTNLRKAPDYLGCDGYTQIIGSDKASCGGFWRDDIEKCVTSGSYICEDYAFYCSQDDEGCRFYEPVSYQGPSVPGVAGTDDMCPSECVGYKTYMEQESFLDRNTRTVDLIARTAQSCPAADNGCEEFTNLSEGPEGERKEYYSAIRSCILPDNPGVATYYSWASTEESGNQLRSWTLLESNQGEYPCTNTETAADGTVSCVDGVSEPSYMCEFGSPDPDLNPVYNPDCVEFTAQSGNSYWMKFSRVVISNEDCVPMRRTADQNIYSIDASLSKACAPSSVGCREYKGSAANNIEIILNDDFEDGTNQGWENGVNSNESLIANGHSYYFTPGSPGIMRKDLADLIHQGRSYKLSFWAKGDGDDNSILTITFNGDPEFEGSAIDLSADWNYYVVNLNNFNREVEPNEYLEIEVLGGIYIDNIILTETHDDLYLIKDSWETPLSCDNPLDNPNADPPTAPGEMIGCEHYRDESNKDWYLKSFTKLCRDELIGCEAMIDMHNSDELASVSYGGVTVPEDELIYLVYDEQKMCSNVGCQLLGLIEPNRQSSRISFEDKFLIVDPDDFAGQKSPLCQEDEVWCDEFRTVSDGAPSYFKNPNVFVCEYKQLGGSYKWYKTGSDEICPAVNSGDGQRYCLGGRSIINSERETNICGTSDDCTDYATFSQGGLCSDWTGICPMEQDNCTEYQDPSNPQGCDYQSVNGEEYNSAFNNGPHCDFYYYKSDKVEVCSQPNLGEGCKAFHQTDGGVDIWYSTARCSLDVTVFCESDADCVDEYGNSLGQCGYEVSAYLPGEEERLEEYGPVTE